LAAVVAGCGTTQSTSPQVACARRDASASSADVEKPATSTALEDAAVDAIRIGTDVVVVTTVAAVRLGGDPAPAPRCGRLVAIDRSSGLVRWSRPRPAECGDELLSVSDDGVWYVDGAGRMLFLSTVDG